MDTLIGKRIELHPGMDLWMRGARYGTVIRAKGDILHVRMDHPQVRKLVKVHRSRITFVELAANPMKYWRRPPKGWWRRCTRGVDESARSYGRRVDSARVCGATWARKSDAEKKAVRREAEREELAANPYGCWGWTSVFG